MSWKCRKIIQLIDKQQDTGLDTKSRHILGRHLDNCPKCRQYAESHRLLEEYAARFRQLRENRDTAVLPDGLNDRIMAAIRAEARQLATNQSLKAGSPKPQMLRSIIESFRHPAAWRSLAGAAAAMLLLAAGLRFFSLPARTGGTANELSGYDSYKNGSTTSQRQSGNVPAVTESNSKTAAAASGWQMVRDPAADIFLGQGKSTETRVTDASAPSATTAVGPAGTTNVQVYEVSSSCLAMLDSLNQAKMLITFTRQQPLKQILFLAAFQADAAAGQLEKIKLASATCATPVRIEIIRISELPGLVDGFGADLMAQSAGAALQGDKSLSWILVLMGA